MYTPLPSYQNQPYVSDYKRILLSQGGLADLEEERQQLCDLQFDLAVEVNNARMVDNFESTWLSKTPQTRQEILLKGIVITCGSYLTMEFHRHWCPETSMKYLEDGGGMGFLNLIATICPQNLAKIELRSKPILIANSVFEATYHIGEPCPAGEDEEARRVMQQNLALFRNFFLTFFLLNTVFGIYGKSFQFKAIKRSGKSDREERKDVEAKYPDLVKSVNREMKEAGQPASERICANCGTSASMLPEGRRFMQCIRCKTVGRKIVYCDKYDS